MLVDNGAKIGNDVVIDRTYVPKEGANNTLDAFDTFCVEWRAQIRRCRLLGHGDVGDRRMLLRR